jgi:hypothetical protein
MAAIRDQGTLPGRGRYRRLPQLPGSMAPQSSSPCADGHADDYLDETSVRKAEPDAPFRLIDFPPQVLIIAGTLRVIDAIWAFSYHGALPDGCKVRRWSPAFRTTDVNG